MPIRPPRFVRLFATAVFVSLLCVSFLLRRDSEAQAWQTLQEHGLPTNLAYFADVINPYSLQLPGTRKAGAGTKGATGPDLENDSLGILINKNGPVKLELDQSSIEGSVGVAPEPENGCHTYPMLQSLHQGPRSEGKRKFPYSRPPPQCRTFNLTSLENLLVRMKSVVKDPDLYRLFENSYPNTLDTTIKWKGFATSHDQSSDKTIITEEDLAFVITGDINAMWLRDSASQLYSYLPLLEASKEADSLASLWRGVINSHARYIIISPYCHSFQPPKESGVSGEVNGAYHQNHPDPPYDPQLVFDCKWELDSLASFLQISVAYYEKTQDLEFFGRWRWVEAVKEAIDAAGRMREGTYGPDGKVLDSAWTFTGYTNRGSETLTNDGLGNPSKANGMVRSAFRPSDDASIYQFLVPANMMFATYLESASLIMAKVHDARAANLSTAMQEFAYGIRKGIDEHAIVHHKEFGDIFAYEVDGFGSANLMDDANIPSLLAMPLWTFASPDKQFKVPPGTKKYSSIYNNTRNFVLSKSNPYWAEGPVLSAIGGSHLGPGKGWPMAAIVRAITAYSPLLEGRSKESREEEIREQLGMVLNSTDGEGVIHESVKAWNQKEWTRSWFGWANGLYGELILKIEAESRQNGTAQGGLLSQSWQ